VARLSFRRIAFAVWGLMALAACSSSETDGPVNVVVIESPDKASSPMPEKTRADVLLRGATAQGLVTLDAAGEVVAGLAEAWIVTDEGRSYIFRLRSDSWPDGEPITANRVADLQRDAIDRVAGTALGLDLEKIDEVRAMTSRIVEIRLAGPMPEFLRLLAQPELGLINGEGGAGPMMLSTAQEGVDNSIGAGQGDGGANTESGEEDATEANEPFAQLYPRAPEERGLVSASVDTSPVRPIALRSAPITRALTQFRNGSVALVLGGTLNSFPLAETGPLSRGTVQVDPALGLYGLAFQHEDGLLSSPARREALSMALNRGALIEPFALGGWEGTNWIVPQRLFSPLQYPPTRWSALTFEQRVSVARERIRAWEVENGEEALVHVALPEGPGSDLLFRELARAWSAIGVASRRAGPGEIADLALIDTVARYSSPRWFLNQLNCALDRGLCSPQADELVRQSLRAATVEEKLALLADAHADLVAREAFIPLGAPVRWSLVRGAVSGYQANPWAQHPLFALSQLTT
jgi:ABC-type transport system substrate-binding protein